jgi:predicted  nucleic acid-binding Zn-ribbon protein
MRKLKGAEKLTASAMIILDDNTSITRVKGARDNCYLLNAQKFTKVGREVPKPIREVIGEIALDINGVVVEPVIQMQDVQPFMITESAPVRGALLNYLTGISIASSVKKEINQEIFRLKKKRQAKDEELGKTVKRIKRYRDLDKARSTLEMIRSKCTLIQRGEGQVAVIRDLSGQLAGVKKRLLPLKNAVHAIKPLAVAGLRLTRQLNGIANLCGQLKVVDARIASLSSVDEAKQKAEEIRVLTKKLDILEHRRKVIGGHLHELEKLNKRIGQVETSAETMRKAVKGIKRCSKCGSVLNHDANCVHN